MGIPWTCRFHHSCVQQPSLQVGQARRSGACFPLRVNIGESATRKLRMFTHLVILHSSSDFTGGTLHRHSLRCCQQVERTVYSGSNLQVCHANLIHKRTTPRTFLGIAILQCCILSHYALEITALSINE